jgi:hypothetical protein
MSGYINNKTSKTSNSNYNSNSNYSNNSNSNYNNNNNNNNNKSSLPEQEGLYGIVSSTIGITEYIAFFIINKITTILGIDTSGKDLNKLLDEIYKVLEDPVTRKKFLLVMSSIAEILVILVDELSGPLKEATLIFIDLGQEATVKLAKSFVAASIDALGVVPITGEIIEGIKLFDDVAKQIQSSISVFLKTFTLLTNLLGASLDSFENVRTRIEGSVDKIKSQLQGLNINMPSIPSLDSLPSLENLERNINTGVSNFANSSLKEVQDKINTGIANAIPSAYPPPPPPPPTSSAYTPPPPPPSSAYTPPPPPPPSSAYTPPPPPTSSAYEQTGGIKNIKKNINKTSNRITKKLNMFYNRKYKTNMTRRHDK